MQLKQAAEEHQDQFKKWIYECTTTINKELKHMKKELQESVDTYQKTLSVFKFEQVTPTDFFSMFSEFVCDFESIWSKR